MAEKKYYWLKLKRDFFKRHDIQIIEDLPNGKDYILFYMKLLVESIDHEGELRFSDTVPYNEQMLSSITRTNVDIVRSAVKIFAELGMMEQMDDGTLFMRQVSNMIGDETEWAEKKRIYRANKDKPEDKKRTLSDKSIELELDKEIRNTREGDSTESPAPERKRFIKPTLAEIFSYCQERKNGINPESFIAFYESNGWKVGKNPMKSWTAAVRTWENRSTGNAGTGSALKVHTRVSQLEMDE